MKRSDAERKRDRAIKQLRDLGMSDGEIEAELGNSISRDEPLEIVDAEIVDEVPNLPAVVSKPWTGAGMDDQIAKRTYQARPGRDETNRSTNPENIAAYDASLELNAERRCRATNTKGEPCRKYAIAGSTVCRSHGGSTHQVVNKARVRIEMASNRLMGKLIEFAFDDTKPAGVQLDAIKDSLNRAGLKPPEQVAIGPVSAFDDVFSDIVSGPINHVESESVDSQDDSQFVSDPNTASAGYADDPPEQRDYDPLSTRENRERPAPRASHRPTRQNGPMPITGLEAIRLANEMRVLPPGRGD